jgi:Helicase associated domain
MVAFIDPRQSKVDITQAVGRAMRKPRGPTTKTFGYIVVPVFAGMGEKDTLDDAIKREKFDAVVDVLNSLREHDEELVDIIREIKERKGANEPFNPRRLNEKVEVIGPRVDLDRLTTSIEVEVVDRIGSSWDEWFGLLLRFKALKGHCRVPSGFKSKDGYALGNWVSTQRKNKGALSPERTRRLSEIGFIWRPFDNSWEEGFAALTAFKGREGHCRVPRGFKSEDGYVLGNWVSTQRRNRQATVRALSDDQIRRLDEIGFIWNPMEGDWEEGFAALMAFNAREGHCHVPRFHTEGKFNLGHWVRFQRKTRNTMPAGRRRRLDEIGLIWQPMEGDWEEGFAALMAFSAHEGHCRVPRFHTEGKFNLGHWVKFQRANRDRMPAERKRRLDDIGFAWAILESQWEEGFAALTSFRAREGHCRISALYKEGDFKLGQWVGVQRRNSVYSAGIETLCPPNASSGWKRLALFGVQNSAAPKASIFISKSPMSAPS